MKVKHKIALGYIKTKLNLLSVIDRNKAGDEALRLFCTPVRGKNKGVHHIYKEAENHSFEFHGNTIYGYMCNPTGNQTVLLLHGFSSTCQNFAGFAELLVKKNFRVLAFDAPAHGRSGGTTVNALEYAELIQEICRRFGPVHGFIAHSFGGISVALALEKMAHTRETKVVLIAPATETSTAIDSAFGMLSIKNKVLRNSIDKSILKKSGKETAWFSIRRAIKNINASFLWIHDENDDVTPVADAVMVMKDAPPNVHFIITSGLGHRRIYRDPVVVQHVVNFFDS